MIKERLMPLFYHFIGLLQIKSESGITVFFLHKLAVSYYKP